MSLLPGHLKLIKLLAEQVWRAHQAELNYDAKSSPKLKPTPWEAKNEETSNDF